MPLRRSKQQTLAFPGKETREFWSCDDSGQWKRLQHAHEASVLGLEMLCFDSAPFWSLNHADSPDEAVALRWEGLGLTCREGARLWSHWKVATHDKQTLVGTLALVAEPQACNAEQHEPSARLLPLPANGLAVWKELGRFVIAFTRGAELVHAGVLTARELDADAAFEARDVCAALLAHGFIQPPEAVHVWTPCGTDFAPQLACLFENASVIKAPRPDPRPPAEASGLLPASVAVMQQARQRRLRQIMMLASATALYVFFFSAWWLRLQWRESQLNRAETSLAASQPEIDRVRDAQARWLEMETAIDPDLYPVELFHQIVSLLPEEGIRLKEFQIEDDRLILSGEATTVNHALGFKDRLAACEPLQRYAWNFPVPAIREDNRADFRAEGTLNGEVPHEAQ
ncbi:MAG: hypothetical protein Q8M07_15910 [Prosthecobacter sp.]|nr:hypothetical protein [Prosthecobacter sp.]